MHDTLLGPALCVCVRESTDIQTLDKACIELKTTSTIAPNRSFSPRFKSL